MGFPMHVAHVMTRLLRAGSEENVLLTVAGQLEAGTEVTLIHGRDSNLDLARRLAPEASCIEIPDMVRPIRPIQDFRALAQIRRVLSKIRPDVVHTHQSKAGIIGRLAARAAGIDCIVHGVHILPFLGVGRASAGLYLAAEAVADRVTHGYIHVSEGMKDACAEYGIGRGVPHIVIPSGFDLGRFAKALPPDDRDALLGHTEGDVPPIVVTMLAALEPRKRHLKMIRSLSGLLAGNPRLRLVIAGEGPSHDEIAALAASLGIAEQVRLTGYRDDPERIIAMSDICILASGQEGLPRSVLQYVAASKPVVMFELPGVDVVAKHRRNALILPPDDWDGFRDAIQTLADNEQLREDLALASGETDLSAWDWRLMGRDTNAFYQRILGTPD